MYRSGPATKFARALRAPESAQSRRELCATRSRLGLSRQASRANPQRLDPVGVLKTRSASRDHGCAACGPGFGIRPGSPRRRARSVSDQECVGGMRIRVRKPAGVGFAVPPASRHLTQIELAWAFSALDAVAVLAVDQEAEAQLAVDQDAEAQLALDHEAVFQDALAVAAFPQLAASKVFRPVVASVVTNWFRPAFGFVAPSADAAAEAETMPTPSAPFEP